MNVFNPQKLNYKLDPQYQRDLDPQRFKIILSFMSKPECPILDLGPSNRFGRQLSKHYGVDVCNTSGDIDHNVVPDEPNIYKTVWFFELIEHIYNPEFVLRRLKDICSKDARIYITYPCRALRAFWTYNHYHEIDKKRFKKLIEDSGYEITKEKHVVLFRKWTFYISGIRPLLRLMFGTYHHNYYELRIK